MLHGLLRDELVAQVPDRKRKTKDTKDSKKRDGAAPPNDRIPLPSVPPTVLSERRLAQKEAQKKVSTHDTG
jgi:hypothetical protein